MDDKIDIGCCLSARCTLVQCPPAPVCRPLPVPRWVSATDRAVDRGRTGGRWRGPSGRGETAATLGRLCFPRNEADVAKADAPAPPTEPVVAAEEEEEEEEAQESNNSNKGRTDHGRRAGTNSS